MKTKIKAYTFCAVCEEYYEIDLEASKANEDCATFYINGLHIHTTSIQDKVLLPPILITFKRLTGMSEFIRMLELIQPLPF